MEKISEELIDEIKRKNDIVDVISDYVAIMKKGKNFVCLCPFHNDTNPSMIISQEKQIYKCFSCGAGGNVLSFVQNYEKISFVEALHKLANQVGIQLEVSNNKHQKNYDNFKEYYDLNESATNLFSYLINENDNQKVLNFINERDYNKEVITKFKIGFLDDNNTLTNLFKSNNFNLNHAVEIGLLKLNDHDYQDVLKMRIIYPIINEYHKVVGFSARALTNDIKPKYLNSIESKIFDKSAALYNINNAYDEASKTKTIYLVEGPNDVIAFDKANYTNTVCLMGTSLSKQHLNIFKKLKIQNIVLAFDGDEAGKNATIKAAKLMQNSTFKISVISFDELDPDEFLKNKGLIDFKNNVENAIPLVEFVINYEFSKININNYLEKKELVIKLLSQLLKNIDNFDREYYYNQISRLSGFSLELINSFNNKKVVNINADQVRLHNKVEGNDIENASKNIIFYLMYDKSYHDIFKNEVGNFISNKYRKLYNVIAMLYLKKGKFEIADIYNLDIEQEVIDELTKISLLYDYEENIDHIQLFNDCLKTLSLENYYQRLEDLNKQLKIENEPLKQVEISKDILKVNKEIIEMKMQKFNK